MENYSIYGPWPDSPEHDVRTVETLETRSTENSGELSNPKSRRLTKTTPPPTRSAHSD